MKRNYNLQKHQATKTCRKFLQRNQRTTQNNHLIEAQDINFTIQNEALEKVNCFKYLGRMIVDNDDDWHAIKHNLTRTSKVWARFRKSLIHRKDFSETTAANFYKVVVMSVLLYSSDTWFMSSLISNKLWSFHHSVIRSICRLYPSKNIISGEYEYPSITEAMQ